MNIMNETNLIQALTVKEMNEVNGGYWMDPRTIIFPSNDWKQQPKPWICY